MIELVKNVEKAAQAHKLLLAMLKNNGVFEGTNLIGGGA